MSVKSKAQLERLRGLVKEGKLTQPQFDEYVKGVNINALPEKVAVKPSKSLIRKPIKTR